jgi:hypothetical protein
MTEIRSSALVGLLICALLSIGQAAPAATISGNLSVVASGLSGPLMFTLPTGPTPIYAYNALDSGTGTATSISGFASLIGVTPSDLTMTYGDIERLSTTYSPGGCSPVAPPLWSNCASSTNNYGNSDAGPTFFNVILAGTGTILSGTIISLATLTNTTVASPGFATATGSGLIQFTSGLAPYYTEALSLTGGSGYANLNLSSFNPVCALGSDPCGFNASGTLTFVPEPSTALLLGGALAALAALRGRGPGGRRRSTAG